MKTRKFSTENYSIEVRREAEKHLEALEAFIESRGYVGYRTAKLHEIALLEKDILDTKITSVETMLLHLNLKGQLEANREALTTFEDGRNNLKALIEDMLDYEDELRQPLNK